LGIELKKQLYILVGPKGSGKTTIGTIVDRETNISFLRVEPIWLALEEGENGWEKVREEIDRMFEARDQLMIESLGAGEGFKGFYNELSKQYGIKFIKIHAELDTCLERVRNRDSADHIPISDDKVQEYNAIASKVSWPWAATIDNERIATVSEILSVIERLDQIEKDE